MLIFLIVLLSYIAISVILYFTMRARCRKSIVFKAPKYGITYILLSATWGIPMTLVGLLVALVLLCTGKKPIMYGWCLFFEFDNLDWGLNLGLVAIVPKECDSYTRNHEHGHGIQNVYFGIFTPAIVAIPSVIRFWVRRFKEKRGENLVPYDAIWFEGSATESGKNLMRRLEKK